MITARERMKEAYAKCFHPNVGGVAGHICADCCTAALIAHAEAVREECAQLAESHFIPGHSVAGHRFAAACAIRIRAIEVK